MENMIMCIGNIDGGDDSVGPYIADKMKNNKKFLVINCETNPENYTSIVKKQKPDKLMIIDAVDMNLEPGEIRIVPKEKIGVMTISTHGIPVSVLINYLEQYIEKIILIGIQPKKMSGKISEDIQKSANDLIEIIKKNDLEKIKKL